MEYSDSRNSYVYFKIMIYQSDFYTILHDRLIQVVKSLDCVHTPRSEMCFLTSSGF